MIQEYALEKLTLEAESQETYKRHATYFHKLAKCTVLESGKLDPTRETERLDEEYDNYRAALSWFITNTQVTESHELTANLWRYWYWRGIATEGLHWLEQTLNLQGQVAPEVRSATLYNASVLALQTDNYSAAKRYAVECVSLKSDCGDLAEASAALRQLAVVEFLQNDLDKALLHLQESVALSEEAGCEQESAESLLKKGWILFFLRNYSEAKEHVLKALDVFSNSATAVQLSDCWHLLGDITAAESRLDEALGYLRKAKSIMPDSMNYYDTIELDLSIGKVSLEQRQLETANHTFKKCLTSASDMRDRFCINSCIRGFSLSGCTLARTGGGSTAVGFL